MGNILEKALDKAERVVLLGHVHPDGDCVGTSLGLYNYLKEYRPQLKVDLYLDHPPDKFSYLKNFDQIRTEFQLDKTYDLCITLDSSDIERLGEYGHYFRTAKETLCLDHHVTNQRFARDNYVIPQASSCSEVLCELLEMEKISKETAECLYTGIIHDTGVFKFSNTSSATMEVAGHLMEKGLNCAKIIDDSFYRKTYVQNLMLGRALLESSLFMDGRCIFSSIGKKDMEAFGADSKDLDGIIDQLRVTAGVECAVFIYEQEDGVFKVSMRANEYIDVSKIASYFGGGGHIRASGCSIKGSPQEVLKLISGHIASQIEEHDRERNV